MWPRAGHHRHNLLLLDNEDVFPFWWWGKNDKKLSQNMQQISSNWEVRTSLALCRKIAYYIYALLMLRTPVWNETHFLSIFIVCLLKWMCDWDSDQLSPPKALSQKIGWTAINAKMDAFRQKIDTQGPPIGTLSRCPPIILQFGKEFCLFVRTIFLQDMCKWMIKFYVSLFAKLW